MLSDLNLKGTDLLVYAIIYGFCQVSGHSFHGSIKYLQEWTNCSKPCIIGSLNSLVKSGLLIKQVSGFGQPNKYMVNNFYQYKDDIVNNINDDGKESLPNDSKESLPNNINNNNINNIKYNAKLEEQNTIKDIIKYMNNVCNTSFRINSSLTQKSIKARLKEGFTLDDFKAVIDYKFNEWGKKPILFTNGKLSDTYLRPATLFGNKFETYLYEAKNEKKPIYIEEKTEAEDFNFEGLEKF